MTNRVREKRIYYYVIYYSTIVKIFTSTRPGTGLVLCFDAKIPLHIPFARPNANANTL